MWSGTDAVAAARGADSSHVHLTFTDRGASHRLLFVLAYAISWTLMMPAVIAGELEGLPVALFFIGVFGPAGAGAIVIRATGGSIRGWLRGIFKFRVPARFYVAAVGFPVVLAIAASAGFALAGESLDFGLAGERAAAFLPLLVFCLLLNGGPEEPGWRGFALPRLQERLSPVGATFVLGGLWGLWHLPLLRVEANAGHELATVPLIAMLLWTLGRFVAYSFTYTYAWNRTGSVVVCMILHAAYNTSWACSSCAPEDELDGGAYVAISLILTGLLWLVALGLIAATRGRLGLDAGPGEAAPAATAKRRSGPAPNRFAPAG
jgi:membrane protease YdiL (CAAX protease family)